MRKWLCAKLLDVLFLCVVSRRPPDFTIGGADRPYMHRWHLIRWKVRGRPWLNLYLHRIMRDDDDRALHDHPWANASLILDGVYDEVTPDWRLAPFPGASVAETPTRTRRRRTGALVFRRATAVHRLALPIENGGIRYTWTLFATGPKVREWGFHCPKGWVHHRIFTAAHDPGDIGAGCGE